MDHRYELYYCLKKLGFKKPNWATWYLNMHCGFQKGDLVYKNQYGGGSISIKFGNYEFLYSKTKYDHLYAYGIGDKDINKCIILKIPRDNEYKQCYIQSLSKIGTCDIDSMYYDKKGTFLIKLAIDFITKVLKEKHNLKIVTLFDNSYKECFTSKIFLANMYFLLNGDTWYGKYEFRPYNNFGDTDKRLLEKYKNNQEIHKITKVKDVEKKLKYYLHKYNDEYFDDSLIDVMINKNENMKLSELLRKILKDFKGTCLMFSKFHESLMDDIGMYSFAHKSFYANIN